MAASIPSQTIRVLFDRPIYVFAPNANDAADWHARISNTNMQGFGMMTPFGMNGVIMSATILGPEVGPSVGRYDNSPSRIKSTGDDVTFPATAGIPVVPL